LPVGGYRVSGRSHRLCAVHLIGLFTNLFFYHRWDTTFRSARLNDLGWWVIVPPLAGGLIVGVMAKYGSPKIKGHGIPEAMEAVLFNRSRIQPRVAILKPISAAIAIGTGGFGAEGPIIQTGGAVGSLVGQVFHTTASERKVLLACGAAAGMSATFNTPIAGVILAIELPLSRVQITVLHPPRDRQYACHRRPHADAWCGSDVQGCADGFRHPAEFAVLPGFGWNLRPGRRGIQQAALLGRGSVRETAGRHSLVARDRHVGSRHYRLLRTARFGVGYDTIGDILNAQLAFKMLLIVMIAKAVALVISLGSGTSGGLLAPMFMSSAALGGVRAMVVNRLFPSANLAAGAFALVAMGAVFGAASRATFTFIIFAFEITRDYNSVLPLMLVSVIADGVAMLFMPTSSIITEKLARRGLRIHQDYETDVLQQVAIVETMDRDVPTIPSGMRVSELAERIARHDPSVSRHQGLFIVDPAGKLEGLITRGDILRALDADPTGAMSVLEAGSRDLVVVFPDEMISEASDKMLHHHIGRLPVVERSDPRKLVGYLGRHGVMAARLRRLHDEHVREPGWWIRRRV
jgi:chloride channel protein, CIC family